ncbi:hypothetical protein KM043_007933 [Ampulex compressa]|nr:hypothetical protein KM043_007933 [Ampulex compressa]
MRAAASSAVNNRYPPWKAPEESRPPGGIPRKKGVAAVYPQKPRYRAGNGESRGGWYPRWRDEGARENEDDEVDDEVREDGRGDGEESVVHRVDGDQGEDGRSSSGLVSWPIEALVAEATVVRFAEGDAVTRCPVSLLRRWCFRWVLVCDPTGHCYRPAGRLRTRTAVGHRVTARPAAHVLHRPAGRSRAWPDDGHDDHDDDDDDHDDRDDDDDDDDGRDDHDDGDDHDGRDDDDNDDDDGDDDDDDDDDEDEDEDEDDDEDDGQDVDDGYDDVRDAWDMCGRATSTRRGLGTAAGKSARRTKSSCSVHRTPGIR